MWLSLILIRNVAVCLLNLVIMMKLGLWDFCYTRIIMYSLINFEEFYLLACNAVQSVYHPSFLLGLFFDSENGGDMFLRNVGWLSTDYATIIREDRTRRNHLGENLKPFTLILFKGVLYLRVSFNLHIGYIFLSPLQMFDKSQYAVLLSYSNYLVHVYDWFVFIHFRSLKGLN
jgi:hypothetical protein